MPDHCDNLKPEVRECMQRGHVELAPGVYKCSEGHGHIVLPELCCALGLEPTQQNLAELTVAATEILRLNGMWNDGDSTEVIP